jgi:O-methyltransferase
MRKTKIKLLRLLKGYVLLLKPHLFLNWLNKPTLTVSNTLSLTKWISDQNTSSIFNDFYSSKRDYSKRYELYKYVIETQNLTNEDIDYIEFGVFDGSSFNWWLNHLKANDSRFYGFDTFEGLPEDWGRFEKGDMSASMPILTDKRGAYFKGLFQDTMQPFLTQVNLHNNKRKIVHLDADLFSSKLFALTSLAPYLKKNDILLFDEFNVPNHEYFAFKLFCESYYVKTKLIAAVNNYYQIAVIIV